MVIRKPINLLLMAVMTLTAAACLMYQTKPRSTAALLPVSTAATSVLTPTEEYRLARNETELRDLAALEAICQSDAVDAELRADAAQALQTLVSARQRQLAVEGALLQSGLGDCVAVITGDILTLVSQQKTLTAQQSAQVVELAQIHAGVSAANIRVVCAE